MRTLHFLRATALLTVAAASTIDAQVPGRAPKPVPTPPPATAEPLPPVLPPPVAVPGGTQPVPGLREGGPAPGERVVSATARLTGPPRAGAAPSSGSISVGTGGAGPARIIAIEPSETKPGGGLNPFDGTGEVPGPAVRIADPSTDDPLGELYAAMAVAKVEPAPTGEDIIRAIKLKVYQRHYETIFNEAIQARLAVIDAPPEKLEGLKARQVALEELASGLEEDIRQLSAPEHSGVIKARPATGTGAIRYEGSSGRSAEPGSVRRRLEEAHDQLEKLRTDFTDKHPEVIGQLGRIQALEAQFAREVEAIRAEELRLNEGGTSPAPVDPGPAVEARPADTDAVPAETPASDITADPDGSDAPTGTTSTPVEPRRR